MRKTNRLCQNLLQPVVVLLGSSTLLLFVILGSLSGSLYRASANPLLAQSLNSASLSSPCQNSLAHLAPCVLPHATPTLLAIYALAFDNEPGSTNNLSSYYTPTVQSIVSATAISPDRVAVILVDLDGYGDTQVIIAQNGVTVPVEGLPFANSLGMAVTLDRATTEYDMTNGWYLGNFIRWARQLYPVTTTIFSFVGHGAPLTPQLQRLTEGLPDAAPTTTPAPSSTPTSQESISPLPPRWGAHSDFTDYHSASLISLPSLAQALRIGSDNGTNPLTVVDLLHCFSATIEELYEVHPYARTILAAPNYTYAQPTMLGTTLATLDASQSPSALAAAMVASYDTLLPAAEHPRLSIAVDADKIAPIKAAWDQTAGKMLDAFAHDEATARSQLLAAYQASAKYDTTICQPQDWQLAPPDALSDMADFASQLGAHFGTESPVGAWALTTTQTISDAILARYRHDGSPWFAAVTPKPQWNFPAAGIALFSDFAPQLVENRPNFSWQAAWYTYTVSEGNRYPYAFLRPTSGNPTWADIFSRFWTKPITSTTGCIQGFVSGQGLGELRITELTASANIPNAAYYFSATVHSGGAASNPLVRFRVFQEGQPIFENVVGSGYLQAGISQTVASAAAWSVQASATYTVEAAIDIDNRFIEGNEDDNRITMTLPISVPNRLYLPVVER